MRLTITLGLDLCCLTGVACCDLCLSVSLNPGYSPVRESCNLSSWPYPRWSGEGTRYVEGSGGQGWDVCVRDFLSLRLAPGIFFILPCIDKFVKVDLRTKSFDVPPQRVSIA